MPLRRLISLGVLGLCSAASADTPATAAFTLTNNSVVDVGALYVSEPGDEDWQAHLVPVALDADGTVAAGDSIELVGVAGTWDLLVLDSAGEEHMRVMNVVLADGVVIVLSD